MFKIGDMAVYPTHGVGVIEAIEKKKIADKDQKFYVMRILGNGMTIMIPTDNIDQVGLRGIISNREATKVYRILKDRKNRPTDSQTWNRRYREYMERIKTGSVYEVATVLRDLFLSSTPQDGIVKSRREQENGTFNVSGYHSRRP